MRTQSTHRRALRAAAQVARTVRRTVQWPLLALAIPACADNSSAGATPGADAQGLFDAILGDTTSSNDSAAGPGAGDDTASAVDGADGMTDDVLASEDTEGSDGSLVDTGVADIGGADGGVADTFGWADTGATADTSHSQDDTAGPADDTNMPVDDTFGPVDVASADTSELPATCYMPNGTACATEQDCVDAGQSGSVCVEGECNDQDFTSEAAMACCQEQYAANNFAVPGCNPWGPPAPPRDRGYRLAQFAARGLA